jgi:hypothetical protein
VPADGWVVWSSNRLDGRHEIYLAKADGSGVTRMTTEGAYSALWSPDGAWVAYAHAPDWSTRVIRPDRSEQRTVCGPGLVPQFWMLDGSGLVCGAGDSYYLTSPATSSAKPFFKRGDFPQLGPIFWPRGITRDGRYLMGTTDRIDTTYAYENGSFYTPLGAAVLLDLTQPQKLYFIGPGCEPTPSLQDDLIVHVSWAALTLPDIYRMNLQDLMTRSSYTPEVANPDGDWGHEYFPSISNDGKWLVYAASSGCHDQEVCDYEIFIHRLGAGLTSRTRITEDPANDQWPQLYVGPLWPQRPPSPTDAGSPPRPDSGSPPLTPVPHGCSAGAGAPRSSGLLVVLGLLLLYTLKRCPAADASARGSDPDSSSTQGRRQRLQRRRSSAARRKAGER